MPARKATAARRVVRRVRHRKAPAAFGIPVAASPLPAVCGAARLCDADYERAATALACEVAVIKAVTAVEAGAAGFLVSKRPKILFEAHIFSRETAHKYDATNPAISCPTWNRALYKKNGEQEYDRLLAAIALDRAAALRSASWGLFQIMGFNHRNAGYGTIDRFVSAMYESEGAHLDAFVSLLKKNRWDTALREKRWADFAKCYNGPAYAENKYDVKLKAAHDRFATVTAVTAATAVTATPAVAGRVAFSVAPSPTARSRAGSPRPGARTAPPPLQVRRGPTRRPRASSGRN